MSTAGDEDEHDRSLDEQLAAHLRSTANEPDFFRPERNWVQSLLQGEVQRAEEQIRQFLHVPGSFLWTALAMSMRKPQETTDIIRYLSLVPVKPPVRVTGYERKNDQLTSRSLEHHDVMLSLLLCPSQRQLGHVRKIT